MPSSRLYEMLAEAKAKPSGAFQDATAAINAGNQVATSAYDYAQNKRLDTKLSDLLGDPTYGNMTLRDTENKNLGLLELMKLKMENAPVEDLGPNIDPNTGQAIPGQTISYGTHSKRSRFHAPMMAGQALNQAQKKEAIDSYQKELASIRAQKDKVSILGTPVNQDQYDAFTSRENYLIGQLGTLGVNLAPEKAVKPTATQPSATPAPAPPPVSAPPPPAGQPLIDPVSGNAVKDTPANREWLRTRQRGK